MGHFFVCTTCLLGIQPHTSQRQEVSPSQHTREAGTSSQQSKVTLGLLRGHAGRVVSLEENPRAELPTSSHVSVLGLTLPWVQPLWCSQGQLTGHLLLSLRWSRLDTSLLTDCLVFQKRGETTIKDRRKEQMPDVLFPEFKKQCIWLGHRELTEPGLAVAPPVGR